MTDSVSNQVTIGLKSFLRIKMSIRSDSHFSGELRQDIIVESKGLSGIKGQRSLILTVNFFPVDIIRSDLITGSIINRQQNVVFEHVINVSIAVTVVKRDFVDSQRFDIGNYRGHTAA